MDVLRSALGDTKLTYLGYSYGTRLGYTYAEAFPGNVRALVLDGALDPNQDPVDESVAQAGAFQRAFEVFADWCAQQPSCPLGADAGDPKVATANYRKLVLPLLRKPVALRDGRKLAYGDAQTAVIKAMYQRDLWTPLRQGLEELVGGKGETLMRLADAYYQRSGHGQYSNLQDALRAVRCVDDQAVTDPAVALEESRRTLAVAPFEDDGQGPSAARDACAFWPVPPTSRAHQPSVAGLPPVVVVSTTGDPATPYQAGVELAKALHGRLLSVQGNQHGASLSGNQCVDGAVTSYLTDLVLPPDGIHCTLDPS
jgi:pimeloyl-ACP methyl ester carboxylesterase